MRERNKGLKERVRRKEAAGLDSYRNSSGRAPAPSTRRSLPFSWSCVTCHVSPDKLLIFLFILELSLSHCYSACTYISPSPCCSSAFPLPLLLEVPCSRYHLSQGSPDVIGNNEANYKTDVVNGKEISQLLVWSQHMAQCLPRAGSVTSGSFLESGLTCTSSPAVQGCRKQIFMHRCPPRGLMLGRCDCTVKIILDCTSLVQSHELNWKD